MGAHAARPHPYVRAVAREVTARSLFPEGARVLVALSGGPDSSALLLALCEAADAGLLPCRPLAAAHFHHGLRGADADGDAGFSAALAARLGVPCVVGLGAVRTGDGLSPNDAARRARYGFLTEVARDLGADTLATAHTADDQAETVLGRVLRGASVDGLAGIAARRDIAPELSVVRPLLGLRRGDGVAFLAERGVAARHDPSNDKDRYARSRLRKRLPELAADFNPRLTESLGRLARLAADDAALLAGLADAAWGRALRPPPPGAAVHLDVATLAAEPAALRRRVLLRALFAAYEGPDAGAAREEAATLAFVDALDAALLSPRGGALDMPGGVRATVRAGVLRLERRAATPSRSTTWRYELFVPGHVRMPEAGLTLDAQLLPSPAAGEGPGVRADTIHIDARALADSGAPLVVRPARPGERIAPLGMGGRTRKVRDVMASAGWPPERRDSAPVVFAASAGGEETALWIVGLAQSEATRVTGETASVVRLSAGPDVPA